MNRWSNWIGGACALVAVAMALALAGCTPSSGNATGSPGVKLEDKSGVVKEYQDTVAHFPLELPAGYSFPPMPPKALQQGQSEVGVGEGPAYFYWLCAWEADYLKSFNSSDSAGSAKALANLGQWTATSFAKTYVQDPSNAWASAVLAPAKLDDPSGIQNDMAGEGCADLGVSTP